MQQRYAFNGVDTAGESVFTRHTRHPLSIAVLGVTLALQAGAGFAQDRSKTEGALELGATAITDERLGETTEGTGSYTTGTTRSATRLALSPRETPQSISVITRQQMDDQNLTSLSDVLSKTPGVTVSGFDSSRATFSARGFEIDNFQIDGIPAAFRFGNGIDQADMVIYDRVEVLRGSNGLLSGFGSPSATVNLVRKRPTRELSGYASTSAGSWDTYRGEFDIGGALTSEGNVRGRFVSAYEDRQSFMDHLSEKKQVFYGILETDITDDLLLSAGLSRQTNRPEGSSWGDSTPVYDSNGDEFALPRSFNPGTRWSQWDNTTDNAFVTLEQRLANDWVVKGSIAHTRTDSPITLGSAGSGNPNPVDGSGMGIWLGKYRYEAVQNAYDLYASGPFQLMGREHELMAGVSHRDIDHDATNWPFLFGMADNIFNWNGNFPKPDWGNPIYRDETELKETAAYLASRLKPSDDLSIILGARVSDWQLDTTRNLFATGSRTRVQDAQENGVVVPYAGVVYDLDRTYSVYASYTRIFKPHESEKDASGALIEPEEGDAYEVGLKGEFFDGRLNASAALFHVKQDNLADLVGTDPATNAGIYRAISGAETRGIEFEVAGELARNWQVQGGYTHRVTRDGDDDKVSTTEPEDLFRLSTAYRLPGRFDKLTLGGSASYQSRIWTDDITPRYTQGSYWLLDAMARYQLTEQVSLAVNGNNLTDEKYFSSIGNFGGAIYGDPRNYTLTARLDF